MQFPKLLESTKSSIHYPKVNIIILICDLKVTARFYAMTEEAVLERRYPVFITYINLLAVVNNIFTVGNNNDTALVLSITVLSSQLRNALQEYQNNKIQHRKN